MTVFLATGLTAGKQNVMDDERIDIQWFTVEQLDAMIRNGQIHDGKTLVGFLAWQRYHSQA
jgi:ADP-ribose pyrophosphatase